MCKILCSVLRVNLQSFPQFLQVVNEEDAFALASLGWLDDHDRIDTILRLFLGHIALQLLHLVRYDPRLRVEAEVDRVLILHLLQAQRQVALLGHLVHRREMIYLLEGLERA